MKHADNVLRVCEYARSALQLHQPPRHMRIVCVSFLAGRSPTPYHSTSEWCTTSCSGAPGPSPLRKMPQISASPSPACKCSGTLCVTLRFVVSPPVPATALRLCFLPSLQAKVKAAAAERSKPSKGGAGKGAGKVCVYTVHVSAPVALAQYLHCLRTRGPRLARILPSTLERARTRASALSRTSGIVPSCLRRRLRSAMQVIMRVESLTQLSVLWPNTLAP